MMSAVTLTLGTILLTADAWANAAPTLALYAGVVVSVVTAGTSVLVNRRTSRAAARSVEVDASAKGVQSLVQALDRIDKDRAEAERREAEAEDRAEQSRLREAEARRAHTAEQEQLVSQVEALNGKLRDCTRQVADLREALTAAQRQVTVLQDQVRTRDEVIDNQGAAIRDKDRTIASLRNGRSGDTS